MADENPFAQYVAAEDNPFAQYLTPAKPAEDGILGTLGGAFAQTGRAVGAFADTLQNDTPELQAAAAEQQARVKDPRLAAFEADLAQRRERLGKDPGWLDVIGEVGLAAWKNPAGAGLMTVDQLPNSAAVLAGAGAGALAGSAVGPAGSAVGGIIGGLGGMFAGNLAVEGGSRALEHVAKTGNMSSEDRSRLLYEGAIKAGVITGVDAVTFGMTKFLTNATKRAVETATLRVAEQAGVSATEIAARRAVDPAFDAAVMSAQKLAMDGATTFGKRALQTGAALGLETIGEGLGEYLGEFAATGEADKMDAVIEAFSSLGQSAAEVGIAKAWNSRNIIAPIAAAKAPEDAIVAADAALSAPIDTLTPAVDEWENASLDPLGLPHYAGTPLVTFPDGTTMTRAEYEQRGSGLGPMPPPVDAVAENAPLLAATAQEAQTRLDTVQADEGTTDIEARRPKTILKRAAESIDDNELRAILTNPETSAVTARAVHAELAARERTATPTAEGTGGTNDQHTIATMGGTAMTVPDAAPAKNNTVAEAVAILRTPAEQRVPADTIRLRNVAARIGPEVMGRLEQFVKGPFGLTRDERVATERLIVSDARTAAAPAATPATLPQSATQQQLADNEVGQFSQPRRKVFGSSSQLRSETGPDIKGEKVTRNMRKAIVQWSRFTGTKVVFEFAPGRADGAVPVQGENTIHINTAAQINPLQVMGHEVTHVLRDRFPAEWAKLRDALVATMPDKRAALKAFAENYWYSTPDKIRAATAMEDWSRELTPDEKAAFESTRNTLEDFLLDEMVSDLGGKHWTTEQFYIDTFAKIEKEYGSEKAKGIIERLVAAITDVLNKFLDVVRAQKQEDFSTITAEQLEKTRDAMSSAYAKFIRAERTSTHADGPHVTDHRIGTSDMHSRSSGAEGEPQPAAQPVPPVVGDEDELSDARSRELASLSTQRPVLDTLQDIERGKLTMDGEYGYNTFQSLWNEAEGMRAEYPDERTYDIYKDLGGTGVVYGASGYNRYSVKPDGSLAPIPESFSNKDTLAKARAALDAPKLSTQRLFFEAAPNPDDKQATQQWREAGRFGRSRIDERVRKVIVPGLLKDLRITGEIMPQLGGWMDATNPSFALVVSKGDPALAARAIGYVLDQQAMYMLGLERFTGAEKTGIIHFDIAGKDAHKIYMQVRALASDVISGHSTVGNEMYIGVPADRMQALRQSVVEIARTNNLTVGFDEGYGATIKEYGYGIQGERQVARGLRTTARDVNRWREQADTLRSDAVGRRSDRAGVARKSEQRPSYGESGSGEQVVGVHYSRQQRDVLSSAYFGTGMKAQERARVEAATDPRIKKRLYFYANTGNGIAPESDVGYHAHSVTLNNLYDMDVDPQRLYKTLSAADPYQSPNQLMNDFESGVIDAGFDGYLTREFGKGGAVVLLGAHSVPVQYEGERARPDVPIMPAPKFSDEQALRRKLATNRALPAGQMTGLEWKRTLMREMPEFDPRWLDNNKLYYKADLIPRAEPARMSTQRASPWWYSPLARAADTATMKKAPASGWKSWLKSLAAKGVKPDEIKWSGIEEWLDVQGEAQVTREQVQAYLSEFGVKIETILRGERSAVTDTEQDAEDEDVDIELNVGEWQTDDPDEDLLSERASERFDEELDERVEAEWEDIADDIQREARTQIEAKLPDIAADVRRAMGDMFPVDDELVEQAARNIAAAQVAGDTWQEYHDEDADLTDEAVQIEAVERAFAVLSGDMEALEEEARRRARAEIDDDKLLDELIDQEHTWYYDDYDSPQRRIITVDGVDGTFWDSTSYGERNLYFDGRDIPLPRNADDADVEGAIRNYVMEEGLVSGGRGGEFRATKWDGHTTDKNRAVPGSYREVQLTLPIDAFGLPKSRMRETPRITYAVYDAEGEAVASMAQEENAKERADNIGGTYKEVVENTETKRMSVTDYYYTTHWQEANVVGFARWDEHTDSDGKRIMVLQEVQGDWGQQRRDGLKNLEKASGLLATLDERRAEKAAARDALAALLPDTAGWRDSDWRSVEVLGSQGLSIPTSMTDEHVAADKLMNLTIEVRDLQREYDALNLDTPDAAPFIEKTPQWAGLVLKRMIAHAIENGFDKVVWTSGAQQVERWKGALRKEVDTIAWEKTPDGIHITASKRGKVRTDTKLAENALSDAIGKVMAKQIISDPNQSGEITGDDITISDTGMAGFYDRMLPNIANDILRKFDKDVRVKDIEVHKVRQYSVAPDPDTADRWIMQQDGHDLTSESTKERAEAVVEKMIASRAATEIGTQQGFEITDKLRESAAAGMPLFSQRRASSEARKSHARKEWYRSQLSEAVGGLPSKIKTGKEAAIWLQANAGKLQVKKDELTWSGVLDWLATQRSVTGAQIQDWLASNGVRVRDVMLGEESEEYRRLDAELQEQDALVAKLRSKLPLNRIKDQYRSMVANEAADFANGYKNGEETLFAIGFDEDAMPDLLEYGKALNRKNELFEQRKAARGEQVKWNRDDLNIPGGSKYRELLLTLPGKSRLNVVEHPSKKGFALQYDNGAYVTSPDGGTTTEQTFDADKASLWDKKEYVSEGLKAHDKTQFRGSHYNQPNILAHVRFNERTDADGKRVLFIEEVQSDWAQQGRKEGFASGKPALTPAESAEFKRLRDISFANRTAEIEARVEELGGRVAAVKLGQPPSAPFVTDTKSWVALALKRMIAHAVDNGFDRVAWTTGEQQAERYDLSKQVSYVRAIRNSDDTYWVMAVQSREAGNGTGDILFDKDKLTAAQLEETIGKDLTAKIIKQEKRKEHEYTGLDLKVGGEGMDKFYGLPDPTTPVGKDKDGKDLFAIMTVVARSLGATVGIVQLPQDKYNGYVDYVVGNGAHNDFAVLGVKADGERVILNQNARDITHAREMVADLKRKVAGVNQPGFDITDKMREQAAIGMPLFSTKRASSQLDQWLGRSVVRKPMYHGTARNITTFRPQQADAIFLTDDPEFAADFADLSHSWMVNNFWTWMTPGQIQQAKRDAMRMLLQDALPGSSLYMREERLLNQSQQPSQYMRRAVEQYMPSESNIMPLYVRAENPFDYRNPEHVAAIEAELGTSWMGQEFINGEMVEVAQHIGDLERGDWNAIESEPVQNYIRQHHDSFYVRERGVTNLAVFSPNQVKSASGNDGSYSREDNDIRRSETRPESKINFAADIPTQNEIAKGLPAVISSAPESQGRRSFMQRAAAMFARNAIPALRVASTANTVMRAVEKTAVPNVQRIEMTLAAMLRSIQKIAVDTHLENAYLDYVDGDYGLNMPEKVDKIMSPTNIAKISGVSVAEVKAFFAERFPVSAMNKDDRSAIDADKSFQMGKQILAETILRDIGRGDDHRLFDYDTEWADIEAEKYKLNDYGPDLYFRELSKVLAASKKPISADDALMAAEQFMVNQTREDAFYDFRRGLGKTADTFLAESGLDDIFYENIDLKRMRSDTPEPFGDYTPRDVLEALREGGVKIEGTPRLSTPRSRLTGQPINQSWPDPDMTDWDDFVRKMQDDKIDTKRVLRAIRDAGIAVAERFDAYMLETNYHGRAASRVKNFTDGELRLLLEDMNRRSLTMQDLDDYLWARHAPERNAANARSNPAITDGSGMTDAQAADILAGQAVTLNGRTIQLSAATVRAATAVSGRVDAITNNTLDLLVQYGLETQATVDTWKRTYAHYAPLKRDMESDANYSGAFGLGNNTGQGFSIRGSASKRALGSKRSVTDVLANIAMQRERAIVRGEKNRVAKAAYGLALTAPNPEFWIPVNTEMNKRLSPAALAKVIAELVSIGVNPLDAQNLATEPIQRFIDPKTGLEMQRINPQLRGRSDVLSARINGEDRYLFFSNKKRAQEMVRGLKNLDAATVGGFLQVVAPVTRWFAAVNTQYNPVFGLTNGVRDFSTGMLNLSSTPLAAHRGEVAREAFAALRGVYADLRDHRAGRAPTSRYAQLFEQFQLDGGQTGYRDAFATSADRAEAIADELRHAGKGRSWLAVGEKRSHIFGWLSDYNTAVENAMRLASYKVALDKGMSRDAAASLAKNLTVNFNKKGLAATQTGALYAFFNASVQGTATMARTMTTDGKLNAVGQKIVFGGMMLGVLQVMLGAAAGWDDDEPPQFAREKNFIIPILGTDKVVNVPMPLGFHVIPNISRITAEWIMSGFRDPGKRLTRMLGVILDSFNPIGSSTLAQTLSPTIGDPIIALDSNKDWTGKSIYKEDFNKMQPTPGWTRAKDVASPISRWLSYAMNYATGGGKYEIGLLSPTPDQIDYLVGQATGGVGREILKTAQYVGAKVTGEEMPLYKTPLGVGRFVGETKGQASETSRFYDNLRRIGEHKSALEEMKDARDGDALMRYLERHPDARLVQTADKAQREIGYLRRQKRELIEKGASKERVKMIEDKITGLTRRYNEVLAAKK